MKNLRVINLVTATILLFIFTKSGDSLDLENAKEQPCFKTPPATVAMDLKWFSSTKPWYWLLMSRYDLYTNAMFILKNDGKSLTEDELYKSCMTWEVGENKLTTRGFGNHESEYNLTALDSGFETFELYTGGDKAATVYTTLTDNSTFTVTVGCLSDDQMVWGVTSPSKELPDETVKLIHDHVKSLGFKQEYFTGLGYDSCNELANLSI